MMVSGTTRQINGKRLIRKDESRDILQSFAKRMKKEYLWGRFRMLTNNIEATRPQKQMIEDFHQFERGFLAYLKWIDKPQEKIGMEYCGMGADSILTSIRPPDMEVFTPNHLIMMAQIEQSDKIPFLYLGFDDLFKVMGIIRQNSGMQDIVEFHRLRDDFAREEEITFPIYLRHIFNSRDEVRGAFSAKNRQQLEERGFPGSISGRVPLFPSQMHSIRMEFIGRGSVILDTLYDATKEFFEK
jgi:hypothetical protein